MDLHSLPTYSAKGELHVVVECPTKIRGWKGRKAAEKLIRRAVRAFR
jgi:inorganic pyrophosphatase